MIVLDKKILTFNIKDAHFSDYPYDIDGCDFLNFHYCKNKINTNGFNRQKELTLIIDLTQNLDTIWQNINKDTRKRIKRAQRDEVKVRVTDEYDQFYQIYRSFMQKKRISSLFVIFGLGNTTLETMKKFGTLFVAEYNEEILGGILFLEDNSNIEALLSASKRLEVDKTKASIISNANRLLYWEAIKYAKEKGIKEFDFGGLWSDKEAEKDVEKKGINSFKLSFGGEIVTRYSYQKIYSKIYNLTYNLYNLKNLGQRGYYGKKAHNI